MTLQEAADFKMCGCVLIVWTVDDLRRRTSLFHVEVNSGGKTVCGRETTKNSLWLFLTCSIPELARRVREKDNLCSECVRLLADYDFSLGKEPSLRKKEPSLKEPSHV